MNELTLRIASATRGKFQSEVHGSPFRDRPKHRFSPPLHPREVAELEELSRAHIDALAHGRKPPKPRSELSPENVGRRLFACALGGEIDEHYRRCLARDDELRLRLLFEPGDPEAAYLSSLPWERMFDARSRSFVGRQRKTPLIRDVALAQPLEPLAVELPLGILVVDAAPQGMQALDLASEKRRMQEALAPLRAEGLVEVTTASTVADMRERLLRRGIHVLHFMGHGGWRDDQGLGGLFFETAEGGRQQIDGDLFGDLVGGSDDLRLVVLNACHSARYAGDAGRPFDYGVAAGVLQRTGRSVVAMQHAITDPAAIAFSSTFYRGLAQGDPVDVAAAEARLMLAPDGPEWSTPVLFLSAPDGRMFEVGKAKGGGGRRRAAPRKAKPPRVGIRSTIPEEHEEDYGRFIPGLTDDHLDLRGCFDGRFIREQRLWDDAVVPELRDFLRQHELPGQALDLVFAAHGSIAFAAGWALQPKGGLTVTVSQPTGDREARQWAPDDGSEKPAGEELWQPRPDVILAGDRPDVALVLSVSREIGDQVRAYVEEAELPVGRIVEAVPTGGTGHKSVIGGAHSLQLANALDRRAAERRPHERRGRLHVFPCAPNALLFHLGRLSRGWGTLSLYEYPFGMRDVYGEYRRSITLPPLATSAGSGGR